jgi:ribulose-5-phosphate 4-epimerase/fuculose-1-phosphate aldolase
MVNDEQAAKRVCTSLDGDMTVLGQALLRFHLIDTLETMDASLVSDDRLTARVWPDGTSTAVAELPEVHRTVYETIPKAGMVLGITAQIIKEVAKLSEQLQLLAQSSAFFYEATVTCDCIASAKSELQEKPNANVLFLRDKEMAYIIAKSPADAFTLAFYLEKACMTHLLVKATNDALFPDDKVMAHANRQLEKPDFAAGMEWPAVKASMRKFGSTHASEEVIADAPCSDIGALRTGLAKVHHELNKRGLDELVWNHCSAKVGDGMLVTPGNCLWDCLAPDDLLLQSENVTANILHSAIYSGAPTAGSVIHTHTAAIEAVSCTKTGLVEPVGSEFVGRVIYHDWEGVSDDSAECERISSLMKEVPNCIALICRNHGAFTWGSTPEEALSRHLALDAACREQLLRAGESTNGAFKKLANEPLWRQHCTWPSTC